MSLYKSIIYNLPEVVGPTQKKLAFKEKLKWTIAILILFFVLGLVPLIGLGQNQLEQFEYLSIILGASFGSIISLGIGPLVTGSIVLQLLNGSGLVKFDLSSPEGKKTFQGTQKLLGIAFILFEAIIYVLMGGLAPNPVLAGTSAYMTFQMLLIFQLILGGFMIMFMDEVVSKWGFGSGLSLFIAAGVSQQIFVQMFSPMRVSQGGGFVGAIPEFINAIAHANPQGAMIALAGVLSTILVFVISIYAQAMKVEIPLSFGRVRGYGIRWPLSFIYTSNIPVILVAALLANIQLWARLLQNWGYPILGTFSGNTPATGLVSWVNSPDIVGRILRGSFAMADLGPAIVYLLVMILGSVVFSLFWVQTSGMDAKSQAKNIMKSGLQIPGFRRDPRVLEQVLQRYIGPLTVMGAMAVGFLAAIADLSGSLSRGTGILLAVMIIYKLYEEIAKEHMMDMHPMMRKFME